MRAMVLAAGLGTRLRPLTDKQPKALVELAGHSLLEITLTRLRNFGIHDVIINTHHVADAIVEYLARHENFGMRLEISHETALLDTGGGLKKAAPFFLDHANPQEPFLLHNVDVISNIDLNAMVRFHQDQRALATLAVQKRETSRQLLFDEGGQLCGRRTRNAPPEIVRASAQAEALAFCGIHVISTGFLTKMTEDGAFSIIASYLRLAAAGEKIQAFRADNYYWRDLGKPDILSQAAVDLEEGRFTF